MHRRELQEQTVHCDNISDLGIYVAKDIFPETP